MRSFTVTLIQRRWLSEHTFELTFSRPTDFDYVPGQRIRLAHQNIQRDYSLVSIPRDSELVVCVRLMGNGVLTPVLADLAYGSTVAASGPHGYFSWRVSSRPAVLVATGTGIAPFVAFVRSGAEPHLLLHGIRHPDELYYQELFSSALTVYVPCLSGSSQTAGTCPRAFQGRTTAYLSHNLEKASYDFYLCGRLDMIREATLLADRYFPGSHVYSEIFF
jgi:ferredoxin-NADP reductase